MEKIELTDTEKNSLLDLMEQEIETAVGKKALEYGSGVCSLAAELREDLEYLACTDRSGEVLHDLRETAAQKDIYLIPDAELSEDCYFGRFHLVYTLFGFHKLPHLVDEIMRLRRLILKGGKMVIIGFTDDQSDAECIKQLKRCGFTGIEEGIFDLGGMAVFRISAVK